MNVSSHLRSLFGKRDILTDKKKMPKGLEGYYSGKLKTKLEDLVISGEERE